MAGCVGVKGRKGLRLHVVDAGVVSAVSGLFIFVCSIHLVKITLKL